MAESMLNKWDYGECSDVMFSGKNETSYKAAAEFLGDECEDWGGGTGWARKYFRKYKNIDASAHKNVDEQADLVNYTSKTNNILMRQVLEYNWEWKKILENVKKSFRKKFCLIVMTPLVEETRIDSVSPVCSSDGIMREEKNTPDIYFNPQDILNYFPESEGYKVTNEIVGTNTPYGQEWIVYVEKV